MVKERIEQAARAERPGERPMLLFPEVLCLCHFFFGPCNSARAAIVE